MWAPCGVIWSPPITGMKGLQTVQFLMNERCVWIPRAKTEKCNVLTSFGALSQSSLRSNYTLWGKNTLQQQLHIRNTEKKICCRSEQTFSISQEFPNCSLRWGNYILADKSTQISLNIIRPERRRGLSLEETQAVTLDCYYVLLLNRKHEVSIRTSFTLQVHVGISALIKWNRKVSKLSSPSFECLVIILIYRYVFLHSCYWCGEGGAVSTRTYT